MDNELLSGYLMGQNDSGSNNNDMFGGGGGWSGLLGLIVVASLFGLGRNNSPFGGGGGGGDYGGVATRADINAGFQFQDLQNGIRGLTNGLSDATYALNNSITNGFHSVDNAICNLGYQTQSSFNGLSHQISDCCCQTQRAIDGVNYNVAAQFANLQNAMCGNTRDIIDSQNAGTRAILDFLVQEKLSAKDARIAQLENSVALANQSAVFSAKIDSATAELLRRTGHDCPVGAYLVQPPTPINFPTNGCGTVQFGAYGYNNGGCGCNGYTQ